MKKFLSLFLTVIIIMSLSVCAFAQSPCDPKAYTTIITASDFQASDLDSYNIYYPSILEAMKKSGVPTPDAVLIGGDYSRSSGDVASAGIIKINDLTKSAYPGVKNNSIVSIQGNHDLLSSGYTKTGLHDMGTYLLYVINEDDYPEKQDILGNISVKQTANKLKTSLDSLKSKNEVRPVIIMTHVPLHHSSRRDGADNRYSSLLFDVINSAAAKLDIVFLFGHNHSGSYDDYLGGSVNFLKRGDTIRIPNSSSPSSYNNYTLNFTYTNYGYVMKSGNHNTQSSTNVPTAGMIQITPDKLIFAKFTTDGVHSVNSVMRQNPSNGNSSQNNTSSNVVSSFLWNFVNRIKALILALFLR